MFNICSDPNFEVALNMLGADPGAPSDSFEAAKLILEVLQRLDKEVPWIEVVALNKKSLNRFPCHT